jgi:glycosyltransferase involved in cell wall biosynthesis
MRILFVSKHFPNKQSSWAIGVFKRFKMFIDAIKEIAEIDLLYYVPEGVSTSSDAVLQKQRSLSKFFDIPIRLFLCKRSDNSAFISKLSKYAIGTFKFYQQPLYSGITGTKQIQAFETCLSYNPDAVFVHRLGAMCPIFRTHRALPPVFFDLDDIEHIAFRRGIRYLQKTRSRLLHYLLLPALFWGQYRSVRLSHQTFVCSEKDRRYLTKRCRLKGVVTIPNAVSIPDVQPPVPDTTLLFIGSFSYKPNIDAAEFLIKQIWPIIHQKIPTSTLIIAGSPPERIPSYGQGTQGVRFTGFVEDLDGLYRLSRMVCAPILWGGGTRVKIIEAAAYCKPIVSTFMGAEGIEMHDGHGIFLRDDPKSFAEACIRLLNDHEFCERMGAAARAAIINKYDQKKIKPMIQKYITMPKIEINKSGTGWVK